MRYKLSKLLNKKPKKKIPPSCNQMKKDSTVINSLTHKKYKMSISNFLKMMLQEYQQIFNNQKRCLLHQIKIKMFLPGEFHKGLRDQVFSLNHQFQKSKTLRLKLMKKVKLLLQRQNFSI